jgi:hypothetical protein
VGGEAPLLLLLWAEEEEVLFGATVRNRERVHEPLMYMRVYVYIHTYT